MERIRYKILGNVSNFNPLTGTVEQTEVLSEVEGIEATNENIENAKKVAYNNEIEVYDDGIEEEPTAQDDTDAMLIDHEYRLTLLELGISESEV